MQSDIVIEFVPNFEASYLTVGGFFAGLTFLFS
jgi:hypothetical protein